MRTNLVHNFDAVIRLPVQWCWQEWWPTEHQELSSLTCKFLVCSRFETLQYIINRPIAYIQTELEFYGKVCVSLSLPLNTSKKNIVKNFIHDVTKVADKVSVWHNNTKRLSSRNRVKVRHIKQQRSFCYITRCVAFSVLNPSYVSW